MIDEYHTQNWFQSVTMDCWTDQSYTQHVMTAHGKAGQDLSSGQEQEQ